MVEDSAAFARLAEAVDRGERELAAAAQELLRALFPQEGSVRGKE
jgi:hypothetical protein